MSQTQETDSESGQVELFIHSFAPPEEADVETSYSAVRQYFRRLEWELKGAKRAGYRYLTVDGPGEDELYYGIALGAEFIPHNEESPEWLEQREQWSRGSVVTFPIGETEN